ncbi:4Fe-4S binding protein [Inquilinus sp. Marseille-Q2685]|uniref:4Fe-4S binding protein n=1 Tax=Inquilinus sp. Marseille-Q2685 TaxID=2866581 RepID=UPI001CE495CE|nr:FHA domain-containing protein [Inquilinus sp. Marseille-Q2685]
MLARTAERKMLAVRGVLLTGWVGLIASLFWDPVSTGWTSQAGGVVAVQDRMLASEPYQVGARVFWTMVVPVIPLFLMVFGHEAWRRICPLSLMSQLPRYLGWQRQRTVVRRRTGKLERTLALIPRGGWLERNAWYVQFGILFAGLNARILFINSDRTALAAALILVLAAAFLVGFLWGGKSWCNYFCPANIVQKIYTEPRGLLESAPHLQRPAVPQSMCRSSSPDGDRSACVGCTANCGDIDLEQSYWSSILDPARRRIYYMFNGLIIGFYWYFYLYAGSWDYYLSGVWSHESGALGRLLDPGLYLAGQAIPIPKLAAVPLVMGAAVLASLALGTGLERAYRWARSRAGKPIPEVEVVNHCLSVSAYLSINIFYLHGGRPSLLMLPSAAIHFVDILIVSLSTMWLWQALNRSAFRYEREKIASSLLDQLKKLKVDVSRYLDGRSIGELKPDEVYVLAKVLPELPHDQKLKAYRNLLDDAISTGKTGAVSSAELLHDVRQQMEISDEDHLRLLEEPEISEAAVLDAVRTTTTKERMACVANYHQIIGRYLIAHVASGRMLDTIRTDPGMQATIRTLRTSLQITDAEHRSVMAEFTAQGGMLARQMDSILDGLAKLQGAYFCLQSSSLPDRFARTLNELLLAAGSDRFTAMHEAALSCLHAFGDGKIARWYAQDLAALAGDGVIDALSRPVAGQEEVRWSEALGETITAILEGAPDTDDKRPAELPRRSFREVIAAGLDRAASLDLLLEHGSPVARALTLTAFSYVDDALSRAAARRLADSGEGDGHWLLRQTVDILSGAAVAEAGAPEPVIHAVIVLPDGTQSRSTHAQPVITVGRGPGNDITIASPLVWPYHMALSLAHGEVRLLRLDDAGILIDGVACDGEATTLRRDALLTFGPGAGPTLRIDWQDATESRCLRSFDPVLRLVALARSPALRPLGLSALAETVRDCRVGRFRAGDELPAAGPGEMRFLQFGSARTSARAFEAGDLMDPGDGDGALEIVSDFAVVMTIPRPDPAATAPEPTGHPEAADLAPPLRYAS